MKLLKVKSNHIESAFYIDSKIARLHIIFFGIAWQYKSGYLGFEFQIPFVGGWVVYFNNFVK
jgi:hypothetical protein